mgnify:CR=1 FL=1
MITGGNVRQSRRYSGYKTFTISPWGMARREQGFLIILKVDKLLDLDELLPIVDVPDAVMTG